MRACVVPVPALASVQGPLQGGPLAPLGLAQSLCAAAQAQLRGMIGDYRDTDEEALAGAPSFVGTWGGPA